MNSSPLNLNASLMSLEVGVLLLALGVLLLDLWLPPENRRKLGYLAALAVGLIFVGTFIWPPYHMQINIGNVASSPVPEAAFWGSYVMDGPALFFKRFFLLAAVIVLIMSVEFSERIATGVSEFYSLILFALAGMMFAASANNFPMLFVAVELITVTFYVLVSFQRTHRASLEAGIKYLILGALASAIMVYGIALVYGTAKTMSFLDLPQAAAPLAEKPLFLLGVMLVVAGLAFKISVFPLQIWAPDVYQGAPAPVTAFLAVGSKAAGFILLLRFFWALPPTVTAQGAKLLLVLSALTILYGSLCALPQRNLKRLLAYSGIANAGYMLLGVAAMSQSGRAAVFYYLSGYLFTVLGAFTVMVAVMRTAEAEDISALAGLSRRSPLLAGALTLAMVSLAGIPPLAGFFGKFLLIKAAAEQGATYYWAIGVALVGVVISLYYYFGVVRAIYWSPAPVDTSPIHVSLPVKLSLGVCVAGMLYLGMFPSVALKLTTNALLLMK